MDRGFVEEDFGNGAVKEGEFLVSLARLMRDIAGFFGLVSSWLIFDYGCRVLRVFLVFQVVRGVKRRDLFGFDKRRSV